MVKESAEIKRRKSRTLKKRVEEIFSYIEDHPEPFPKNQLRKLGLGSKSINQWLDLILFIQTQPQIKLLKVGNYTLIQKEFVDDYLKMCWKNFLDKEKPYEKRLEYLQDFARVFFHKEKE
jgi:hypothetical protein